jgi:hypothetical protein
VGRLKARGEGRTTHANQYIIIQSPTDNVRHMNSNFHKYPHTSIFTSIISTSTLLSALANADFPLDGNGPMR